VLIGSSLPELEMKGSKYMYLKCSHPKPPSYVAVSAVLSTVV